MSWRSFSECPFPSQEPQVRWTESCMLYTSGGLAVFLHSHIFFMNQHLYVNNSFQPSSLPGSRFLWTPPHTVYLLPVHWASCLTFNMEIHYRYGGLKGKDCIPVFSFLSWVSLAPLGSYQSKYHFAFLGNLWSHSCSERFSCHSL